MWKAGKNRRNEWLEACGKPLYTQRPLYRVLARKASAWASLCMGKPLHGLSWPIKTLIREDRHGEGRGTTLIQIFQLLLLYDFDYHCDVMV